MELLMFCVSIMWKHPKHRQPNNAFGSTQNKNVRPTRKNNHSSRKKTDSSELWSDWKTNWQKNKIKSYLYYCHMHINIASISSLIFRLTTQRAKQATGEIEIGAREMEIKYIHKVRDKGCVRVLTVHKSPFYHLFNQTEYRLVSISTQSLFVSYTNNHCGKFKRHLTIHFNQPP